MAADNSSDAYKKALKDIENMLKKQEALKKSTDSLKNSWSAISSELFKIDGASFFESVKKSPEELRKIGEEINRMKGQFNILGDALGDALNKNKESQQLQKSIQNAFLNAKKSSSTYSNEFKKNLSDELKRIQLQGGELSNIIKSEADLLDVLKNRKKLSTEHMKDLEGIKDFYKTQNINNDAEEKFQNYVSGIWAKRIENNKELARFSNETFESITKQIAAGKSYNEIAKEGTEIEKEFMAVLGGGTEELRQMASGMNDLAASADKAAKSTTEMTEKFRPMMGFVDGVSKRFKADLISSISKFDDVIHDVQKNSGIMMDSFSNAKAFGDLTTQASQFGVSVEQAGEMMSNMSKELNTTNFSALAQASKDFMAIEGATGAASGDITNIAGEMMRMGASSAQVKDSMGEADKMARQFGVSSSKVIAGISRNIKKMREMGFTGGEKSLAKMAITAERLKMNMDETFDMAKRARSIEGAMDMAAELQLAGGSFANINPMDLLSAARKGPEELQKILTKMGGDIGKFDEKTGEYKFDPVDVDRLQMVSDATGQSMESLQNMIKTNAEDAKKLDPFAGMLDGLDAADQELAKSGLSQMLKVGEGGKIELDASSDMAKKMGVDSMEELQAMSGADLKTKMQADQKSLEEQNKRNQSLSKSMDNFMNALMSLGSLLQPVMEILTSFIQGITTVFTKVAAWGDGFGKYILGGLVGFGLLFGTNVGLLITQGIGGFAKGVAGFGKSTLDFVKQLTSGKVSEALGGVGNSVKEKFVGKAAGGVSIAKDAASKAASGAAESVGQSGSALTTSKISKKIDMSGLLKFSAAMALIGLAVAAFGVGINQMGGIGMLEILGKGAIAIGVLALATFGISKMSSGIDLGGILKFSAAMALVGVSMIPFAFAAQIMTGIDWMSVLAGVGVMALVMVGLAALGTVAMTVGWLILAGAGLLAAAGLALAVSAGGLLVTADAFNALSAVNWGGLTQMGGALLSVVPGMLGFSLAAMMFANPISMLGILFMASALGGLVGVMAPLADSLTLGADSLDRFASGLEKLSEAADKLSLEKLEKLKELSESMATASAGGNMAAALAGASGGSGGNKGSGDGEVRKIVVDVKLNGRDLQNFIVKDTAIIK